MDDILELIPFIGHVRVDVRLQALRMVAGLCEYAASLTKLSDVRVRSSLIKHLKMNAVASEHDIQKLALSCLINMAENETLQNEMVECKMIDTLMTILRNASSQCHSHACMLLANLTRSAEGSTQFLLPTTDPLHGIHLRRIITWFTQQHTSDKDDYCYLSNVLTNITQLESGRIIMVKPELNIMSSLRPQISSPNTMRRLGVITAIRNIMMDVQHHTYMMNPELGVYEALLCRITGPDTQLDEDDLAGMLPAVRVSIRADKKREPDVAIRTVILETLTLCARHKPSRLILKETRAYIIVRELHKQEKEEENETNDQLIEDLVPFLLLDEEDDADKKTQGPQIEELPDEEEKTKQADADEKEKDATSSSTPTTTSDKPRLLGKPERNDPADTLAALEAVRAQLSAIKAEQEATKDRSWEECD